MVQALRARELGAVELLEAHLAAVEESNAAVNAIVLPRFEEARAEAAAADTARARGEPLGPLHGLPFTVKDPIPVAGMRSPNGCRLLADHVDAQDAVVVGRLRRAGAVLIGKTNVSELSSWWDSVNPLFGATANPHDPARTAGGSSGGEAAALATGMSPLGIGSDLGGSIRNPCHFVGVCGLKLSSGLVPLPPHRPLPLGPAVRSFGAVGPLARSVRDLELVLPLLAPGLPPAERVAVAVYEEDGLQPVSRDCREAVRRAAAALAGVGYEVVEGSPPRPAEVRAAYDTLLHAELATGLRGFAAGREQELSPYVRGMLEELRTVDTPPGEQLAAWERLAEIELQALAWLDGRVGLCPCAPETAPPLAGSWSAEIDGVPTRPGGKLTLATYANALGLPAACVPVMRSAAGLPVGVQVVGGHGSERTLLALAAALEQALGGWIPPAPLVAAHAPGA